MKKIRLSLKERSYTIVIGQGLLARSGALLKKLNIGPDAVVITNSRLARLYKKPLAHSLEHCGFTVRFELVPDSEKAKSIEVASRILNRISTYDTFKKIFIVAFGGGVVGDLAGFVAAIYKRGTPYVQIPTTLLAQVDSSIGGKVAIDLPIAKNLAGAFYQPRIVISDISLAQSLPARERIAGLAEIIKYGVIKDGALFRYLERHHKEILRADPDTLEFVVARSSEIKAQVVSIDELDIKGVRAVLNFGHTIGHAIEAASSYSGRYNHGEAVAIGMIAAARISVRLGMIAPNDAARIDALIQRVGLPTRIRGLTTAALYQSYLHDKKFINRKNRFILPEAIGKVRVIEGVPNTIVKAVLHSIMEKR